MIRRLVPPVPTHVGIGIRPVRPAFSLRGVAVTHAGAVVSARVERTSISHFAPAITPGGGLREPHAAVRAAGSTLAAAGRVAGAYPLAPRPMQGPTVGGRQGWNVLR